MRELSHDLIGLVYNPKIEGAESLVEALVVSFELQDISWISSVSNLENFVPELTETRVLITAGGDGTILRTVHVMAELEVPIVGINMGRVGFMSELSVDEAYTRLKNYLEGELRIEERMMLQACVGRPLTKHPRVIYHALNDVVIGQSGATRLLDITARVDNTSLTTYRADAVIVSTATGSTGYAFSAGGPILYPEAKDMLVQPVAPHTGLREGLIFPQSSVIELEVLDGVRPTVSVDGFQETELQPGEKVTVQCAPNVTKFFRGQDPVSFYSRLTRRLGLVLQPPSAT